MVLHSAADVLIHYSGQEKQKKLLASDAGHFSMIKALHLADLITEMNGMRFADRANHSFD
ncbi:MAG: hypothetical protein Q9167_000057 [Letrouitia subvulpina]